MSDTQKKRVLLMGVTGGVGEVVGDKLVAEGYEVYVTCRASKKVEIQAKGKFKHVLAMDLASTPSVEAAFAELASLGVDTLDGLLNCAAVNPGAPMETVSLEEMHRVFQINIFGTLRAVQLAIPLLRPTKGRIVLVGSLSGTYVMPLMGIYSASKYALEASVDALRRELYPWGIKTAIVKPGAIKTAMFFDHIKDVTDKANNAQGADKLYAPLYRAHAEAIPKTQGISVSTEGVANQVMHGLMSPNPKIRYYSGWHSNFTGIMCRFAPDWFLDWTAKNIFALK